MKKTRAPKIEPFSAVKQRRLDQLLDKNSEGRLTPKEKAALQELVADAERHMVANARRLAKFAQRQKTDTRTKRIPVTVWIQPQTTSR